MEKENFNAEKRFSLIMPCTMPALTDHMQGHRDMDTEIHKHIRMHQHRHVYTCATGISQLGSSHFTCGVGSRISYLLSPFYHENLEVSNHTGGKCGSKDQNPNNKYNTTQQSKTTTYTHQSKKDVEQIDFQCDSKNTHLTVFCHVPVLFVWVYFCFRSTESLTDMMG